MNYSDLFLIAMSCVSIPLVIAVMWDIFYAEKKQIRFSLRRASLWYMIVFGMSFIPSVLLVMQNA